jgi:hypothetical protein
MTRRVWNDRAMESPRAGYILIGAGATALVATVVWMLCGWIAGMPGWAFIVALMAAVFGAAVLGAGFHETRQALDHRAAVGDITASFERLLAERRPGQ